jgi:hypothetical protein
MWAAARRLHERVQEGRDLGEWPDYLTMLLLRVQDHAGDAAHATLKIRGLAVRKSVRHATGELQEALCGVICTAMAALLETTPDPEAVLAERMR